MPDRVVDASAISAIAFGEPEGPVVERRIRGAELWAPSLLPYELTSVAAKKIRSQPRQKSSIVAMLGETQRLRIRLVQPARSEVLKLALQARLTPYDAAYLWVAREYGAELVTLDVRLAAAARTEPTG